MDANERDPLQHDVTSENSFTFKCKANGDLNLPRSRVAFHDGGILFRGSVQASGTSGNSVPGI